MVPTKAYRDSETLRLSSDNNRVFARFGIFIGVCLVLGASDLALHRFVWDQPLLMVAGVVCLALAGLALLSVWAGCLLSMFAQHTLMLSKELELLIVEHRSMPFLRSTTKTIPLAEVASFFVLNTSKYTAARTMLEHTIYLLRWDLNAESLVFTDTTPACGQCPVKIYLTTQELLKFIGSSHSPCSLKRRDISPGTLLSFTPMEAYDTLKLKGVFKRPNRIWLTIQKINGLEARGNLEVGIGPEHTAAMQTTEAQPLQAPWTTRLLFVFDAEQATQPLFIKVRVWEHTFMLPVCKLVSPPTPLPYPIVSGQKRSLAIQFNSPHEDCSCEVVLEFQDFQKINLEL
eukprot:NODE_2712_length_1113_cov_32.263692_g2588_i0.p1 GENE.NODE_2712_length_1113_cov_32.263692_g2588_i0~~NODE_2712_length_1113_cov_32.263692_g2588_i0.p1  ORF type:complete len:361 (-),score=138.83 NODE_2712_length_1113_cov_32.263692_g2588_i0:30-1061(-)